jgi:hypothetical protein
MKVMLMVPSRVPRVCPRLDSCRAIMTKQYDTSPPATTTISGFASGRSGAAVR